MMGRKLNDPAIPLITDIPEAHYIPIVNPSTGKISKTSVTSMKEKLEDMAGGATIAFASLSGNAWDGTTENKKTKTLSANTALTLTGTTNGWEGILIVTGAGYTLSINGTSVDLNEDGDTTIVIIQVNATLKIYTDFNGSEPTVYDSDAEAFITAAAITDNSHKNAFNNFVLGLKSASLWDKLKAFYPLYGSSISVAKWNLKNPLDTDAAYRLTQAGAGSFTYSNGVTIGSGDSTTWLNTHMLANAAAIGQNNFCMFASVKTNSAGDVRCAIGAIVTSGTSYSYILPRSSADKLWIANMGPADTTTTNTNTIGRYFASRLNGTNVLAYKDGVELANLSLASVAPGAHSIVVGNGGGGTLSSFAGRISMAAIFTGLTGAEIATADSLIATLETALGR